MEYFIEFVKNWGYVAVLLGAVIEGESVILTAGFLAYAGYLSLPKVMGVAFLGTFFADQGFYQLGYHYGPQILEKFPKFKGNAERAFTLLRRWDAWFILSFRFIYGIRMISPVVVGAARVRPMRFLPLNFIAAVIWTVISCSAGYMLGDIFEDVMGTMEMNKAYVAIVPILIVISLSGLMAIIRKTKQAVVSKDPPAYIFGANEQAKSTVQKDFAKDTPQETAEVSKAEKETQNDKFVKEDQDEYK